MGLRKSRRHSGTGNGVQSRGRSPFPGSHSDFHNVPANIHTPLQPCDAQATHSTIVQQWPCIDLERLGKIRLAGGLNSLFDVF